MIKALVLAQYIINKSIQDGEPISNLQLQKILYFLQVQYYHITGEFLISDDFYAWQYGPVIPDVYYKYCGYGGFKILSESTIDYHIENDIMNFVDKEIQPLRNLSPWDLVETTHRKGGAWDQTYRNGEGLYAIISKSKIIEESNNRLGDNHDIRRESSTLRRTQAITKKTRPYLRSKRGAAALYKAFKGNLWCVKQR